MIKTIVGLYRALEILLRDIGPICEECQTSCRYDDCKGYVWLMPEEADRLFNQGVEIVTVNGDVSFINSFSTTKGIDVGQVKPPCPLCKNKRCSAHKKRPLVCRMYPLGFSRERGIIHLVWHLDCLFADKKARSVTLRNRVRALFKNIDPRLLDRIIAQYRKVLALSSFPIGKNRVLCVLSLEKRKEVGPNV